MSLVNIEFRVRRLVNTDPRRRCYNGCHYNSEWQWADWDTLEHQISEDTGTDRIKFWRELNDYAISERGEGARRELRIVPA